ncbi:MAG: CIA30 family protein [Planctomycetota bacterium]
MHPLAIFALTALSSLLQSGAGSSKTLNPDVSDPEITLAEFTEEGSSKNWIVVNDNVMGGRSTGDFEISEGVLEFAGRTNTRGGGFSSIRTRPSKWDLSRCNALALRVRGDGRTYTAELRTDAKLNGQQVAFRAEFKTSREEDWQSVRLPFSAFKATIRGRDISDSVGPLEPEIVTAFGLMIYDGKDGAFELAVDWIRAVRVDEADWPNGVELDRTTLAELLGIPAAYAAEGVRQIENQLPGEQSLPVELSAFNVDGSPAPGLRLLVRWDGGQRMLRTNGSGSLSIQIPKEELGGWYVECPKGIELRRGGAAPVEVVTQVIGGGDTAATFESVPDDLEQIQVGGLTVRYPSDAEQDAIEAIAELSRIRGFVEAYGEVSLSGAPYGIALIETDASNLSGRGLNIPVPLKRWNDEGASGSRMRSVLVHEWVEYALGVVSGLYVRTPALRFVGDGLAELYSYQYARRFFPLAAYAQLDSYVVRVEKLINAGVDTYSFEERFAARVAMMGASKSTDSRTPRERWGESIGELDLSSESAGYAASYWFWRSIEEAAGRDGLVQIQNWLLRTPDAGPSELLEEVKVRSGLELSLAPELGRVLVDLNRWRDEERQN